jgi:hypothetical protein
MLLCIAGTILTVMITSIVPLRGAHYHLGELVYILDIFDYAMFLHILDEILLRVLRHNPCCMLGYSRILDF